MALGWMLSRESLRLAAPFWKMEQVMNPLLKDTPGSEPLVLARLRAGALHGAGLDALARVPAPRRSLLEDGPGYEPHSGI